MEQPVEIITPDQRGKIVASFKGVVRANDGLRTTGAGFIQKRGFNYTGDSADGWGLRNGMGGVGNSSNSPWNGGRDTGLGFSLQPFGIGGGLFGQSITPSIFTWGGSSAKGFSKQTRLSYLKMAFAVEAYKGFGVVKNVVDLMCNFASEGLKIIHPRPAIQRFYQRWADAVYLQGRSKDALRQYYKTSNVFIYTTMGTIDDIAYKNMKKARGAKDADLVDTNDPILKRRQQILDKEKQKPPGEREIPWRYTLLNPFQMDLRGNKYFGGHEWAFILDEDTKRKLEEEGGWSSDSLDETSINLPLEFKKVVDGNIVRLDQAKLFTLQYMKDDHEDWADPMVWPVMNDIMYKNQLRAMDMSVANSVINAITIFKLGNIEKGYQPPASHFQKLSEMLRTPAYAQQIVWNDAISMESNYPPIEKILSIEKYRSVDRDILAGLGVPSILVDGSEGGSFSNAYLQVRTLLERLEEGRNEILKWIDKQLRIIANVMGHRDIPIVKFGQMSLRDENAEKQLIIQLLDRNIISAERVHEVFDIETDIEIERMRSEKKMADEEDLMVKFGPFKDPMNMMDAEETMNLDFKQKKILQKAKPEQTSKSPFGQQTPNVIRPNGRPPGTKSPQQKKRETKPKGMASQEYINAARLRDNVEARVTDLMTKLRGVKNKKNLAGNDKDDIEIMTFATMLAIHPEDKNPDIYAAMANVDRREREITYFDETRHSYQSLAQRRQLQIALYLNGYYGENDEDQED
jgi:hypothetical protein